MKIEKSPESESEQVVEPKPLSRVLKIKKFLPAIAFCAGFVWDSVTMGKVVTTLDLWVLIGYYFGAGLVLFLMNRELRPKWESRLRLLLQFFFGGLFSALVVFYFKSSGSLYSFLFVVFLVILLVANEFFQDRYRNRYLSWTLYNLVGIMYLNFLIPHIVHSVNAFWFYFSCTLSTAVVWLIWTTSTAEYREIKLRNKVIRLRKNTRQLLAPFAISGLLILLYAFQLIPPVPLVLKQNHVCKDFAKVSGEYTCLKQEQGLLQHLGLKPFEQNYLAGEKIYNLTSVFAPTGVQVVLEQRWWILNEATNTWQNRGRVPLPMTGGRQNGWRTYSFINKAAQPGIWKVETALKEGAVLGYAKFKVVEQNPNYQATATQTVLE